MRSSDASKSDSLSHLYTCIRKSALVFSAYASKSHPTSFKLSWCLYETTWTMALCFSADLVSSELINSFENMFATCQSNRGNGSSIPSKLKEPSPTKSTAYISYLVCGAKLVKFWDSVKIKHRCLKVSPEIVRESLTKVLTLWDTLGMTWDRIFCFIFKFAETLVFVSSA